jgi:hypothetical protein
LDGEKPGRACFVEDNPEELYDPIHWTHCWSELDTQTEQIDIDD